MRPLSSSSKWPTSALEQRLSEEGYKVVAGLDEVGRGPLAGPVVAAAVVLSPDSDVLLHGIVRDSKQLSHKTRVLAYERILDCALTYSVGSCASSLIDRIGIVSATRLAMLRAVKSLEVRPDHLLIDALDLPTLDIDQTSLIKGDVNCLTISAASVVAKVTRDRLMESVFHIKYPGYGFATHKGYGTRAHLVALNRIGPSPIHRRSFAPVRELLRRRERVPTRPLT